MRFNRPCCV